MKISTYRSPKQLFFTLCNASQAQEAQIDLAHITVRGIGLHCTPTFEPAQTDMHSVHSNKHRMESCTYPCVLVSWMINRENLVWGRSSYIRYCIYRYIRTQKCVRVCVCSWTFGQRVQSGCKFTVCLPSFALCPFCCQYNKIGQASVKWLPRPMYLKVGMSQQTAAKPIQWMQRSAQMQKSCDDYADKVTTVSISIKNKTIRLVIFLVCRKNKKITYVLCFSALRKKKTSVWSLYTESLATSQVWFQFTDALWDQWRCIDARRMCKS